MLFALGFQEGGPDRGFDFFGCDDQLCCCRQRNGEGRVWSAMERSGRETK